MENIKNIVKSLILSGMHPDAIVATSDLDYRDFHVLSIEECAYYAATTTNSYLWIALNYGMHTIND